MIIEIEAESQSDAGTTKDTPYLALTGELWGVFCEYLWENQPRYNGTALYFPRGYLELFHSNRYLVYFQVKYKKTLTSEHHGLMKDFN